MKEKQNSIDLDYLKKGGMDVNKLYSVSVN